MDQPHGLNPIAKVEKIGSGSGRERSRQVAGHWAYRRDLPKGLNANREPARGPLVAPKVSSPAWTSRSSDALPRVAVKTILR